MTIRYWVIGDTERTEQVQDDEHWWSSTPSSSWAQYFEPLDDLETAKKRARALVEDGGHDWVVVRRGISQTQMDDTILFSAHSARHLREGGPC